MSRWAGFRVSCQSQKRPNIGRSAPRFAIPKAAMLEATILLPLLGAERPLPRLAT